MELCLKHPVLCRSVVAHHLKEFTGEPSSVTSLFTREFNLYSCKLHTYYWFHRGLTAEAVTYFLNEDGFVVLKLS